MAVDDEHELSGGRGALPGKAWIETFGDRASRDAVCDAIAAGRLYAATGPKLRRFEVTATAMTVWLDDPTAFVEFVGDGGEVLSSVALRYAAPAEHGLAARYTLHGDERYVRARIHTPDHGQAWTQAYAVR